MELIFENHIKAPFTWVENDLIRGKQISLEALGLYMILRSFSSTVHPSIEYLCDKGMCGKNKIYRCLKELEEAHLLLKKNQTRNEKGIFEVAKYRILSFNDDYENIKNQWCNDIQQINNRVPNKDTDEIGLNTEPDNKEISKINNPIRVPKTVYGKRDTDTKQQQYVNIDVERQKKSAGKNSIEITKKEQILPLPPNENEKCEGELISNQNLKTLSKKYSEKEVNTAYQFLQHLIKQGKQIKDPLAFLFTLLKNKTYEDITEIELQEQQKENKERENKLQLRKQREIDDFLDKKTEEIFKTMSKEDVTEEINKIKKTLQCDEKLKDGLALLTLKANIRKDLEFQRANTS